MPTSRPVRPAPPRAARRLRLPLLALLAMGAAPLAPLAAQQQVRVIQRAPAGSARADSMVARIFNSDVAEVKRMVSAWRAREEQLVKDLRGAGDADLATRRRLEDELALHVRDGFAMMSAIEARCVDGGSGDLPAGYLGLNLETTGRVVDNVIQEAATVVTSVEPGSPAERAGLQRHDKVLRIGGLEPERLGEVGAMLVPGRTLVVRAERGGVARDFPLTVARRPEGFGESCGELESALMPIRVPGAARIVVREMDGQRRVTVDARELPPRPAAPEGEMRIFSFNRGSHAFFGGAEFRDLDADWREVLGVKQGVIVNAVASASPMASAGLKGGDVVTAVGRSPVASPAALVQLLGSQAGDAVTLSVVRGKEKKTVTVRFTPR